MTKLIAVLGLCLTLTASAGTTCAQTPFGEAAYYNLVSLGDVRAELSDIEGRVAVAGNASFQSYMIGGRLRAPALVVGGEYTSANVTVSGGAVARDGSLDFQHAARLFLLL